MMRNSKLMRDVTRGRFFCHVIVHCPKLTLQCDKRTVPLSHFHSTKPLNSGVKSSEADDSFWMNRFVKPRDRA